MHTQDEVEGFKGCMGLFLSQAVLLRQGLQALCVKKRSIFVAHAHTQDEVEGFKGCMGLFLSRAVPVLFHHYSLFKRQEVRDLSIAIGVPLIKLGPIALFILFLTSLSIATGSGVLHVPAGDAGLGVHVGP